MAAHMVRVEAAKALEAGGTIKQVALDFGKNYDNLRKALRPLMKRREQEKREREHAIVLELELKYQREQQRAA